ncbi:hypothetical protein [Chryseobacterium sp.]|uniref:hypothetical protein n=1 Tax=Chryseobacterium sp. TaxID=1871047 RepID=UPI00289DC740|nr:hypothetical protein [Chryseobacterium sp.]
MKIAVLARNYQDYNDYLDEIHVNDKSAESFVYIENVNNARGLDFDAVIKTESAWWKKENTDIFKIIVQRIYGRRNNQSGE